MENYYSFTAKDYCSFLSDTFIHDVWIPFSASLKHFKTMRNYLTEINRIATFLKCDFLDISPVMAQSYYDHMLTHDSLTIKSVHTKLGYCRSVASYIADNRDMLHMPDYMNPFSRVDITAFNTYLEPDKVPSLEVIDKLLSVCKQNNDEQLYLILTLVVRCSLTTSQICALKTSMVRLDDSDACFLVLPNGTCDKVLPVPSDVASLLFHHINNIGKTEYLFFNAKGGVLLQVPLQRKVAALSKAAGLDHIVTLQDLRNSSIALMLAGGAPSLEVSTYCDIAPRWLFRFNTVIDSVQGAPCNYANFTVKNN